MISAKKAEALVRAAARRAKRKFGFELRQGWGVVCLEKKCGCVVGILAMSEGTEPVDAIYSSLRGERLGGLPISVRNQIEAGFEGYGRGEYVGPLGWDTKNGTPVSPKSAYYKVGERLRAEADRRVGRA